jgi:hypothetical protein
MMAESKFTPGPLEAKENKWEKHPWEILAGDIYLGVAIETGTEGEAKANAELWADAPRMLGLLRVIHDLGIPLEHGEKAKKARAVFWATKDLLEKHGG